MNNPGRGALTRDETQGVGIWDPKGAGQVRREIAQ